METLQSSPPPELTKMESLQSSPPPELTKMESLQSSPPPELTKMESLQSSPPPELTKTEFLQSSAPPELATIQWTSRLTRMLRTNRRYCTSHLQNAKSWRVVNKVHRVTVWVVSINFSLVVLPLIFLLFLRLLHPHTELQLVVGVSLILLHLACCCLSRHVWGAQEVDKNTVSKKSKTLPDVPSSFFLRVYRHCYMNGYSRAFGAITSVELPFPLSYLIVWLYARVAGCDREEAEHSNLLEYKTVGHFFTRKLKPGLRPVCQDSLVVSPADGKMTYGGVFNGPYLQQVKGIKYHLRTFIGPLHNIEPLKYIRTNRKYIDLSQEILKQTIIFKEQRKTKEIEQGTRQVTNDTETKELSNDTTEDIPPSPRALYECVIYLSPADYHRFHSPAAWRVHSRRHFPGRLQSVAPSIVRQLPGLFHTNERVAYLGTWRHGMFAMVAVGATGVGSIHINIDPDLNTNKVGSDAGREFEEKVFETPFEIEKGEEFGHFSFGSTIVLLFEAPVEYGFKMEAMSRVKVGQGLL